jgi:peptide/nickel transport system substrate-binding protein
MKTHSVGGDACQLTSYAASDHVIIDVNPHSGITTDGRQIFIHHVADPSAQLLMLQKGDADIVRNLTPDQLKTIGGNPDFHVTASPPHRKTRRSTPR